MTGRADPLAPVGTLEAKMREALVLAYARKLERAGRRSRDLSRVARWPAILLRPLTDALAAIALGFLAANISILMVFIVVNILLHL